MRKIDDIISVIDGTALLTNILALNAAVEAARACEQGRGLRGRQRGALARAAQRRSSQGNQHLISASVSRDEKGSALVSQAGQRMDENVASIQRVTSIVGEITSASSLNLAAPS